MGGRGGGAAYSLNHTFRIGGGEGVGLQGRRNYPMVLGIHYRSQSGNWGKPSYFFIFWIIQPNSENDHKCHLQEFTVTDDTVLEEHLENPEIVQMRILGEGGNFYSHFLVLTE